MTKIMITVEDNCSNNNRSGISVACPCMKADLLRQGLTQRQGFMSESPIIQFVGPTHKLEKMAMAYNHTSEILEAIENFDNGYTRCRGVDYYVDDYYAKIFVNTSSHCDKLIRFLETESPKYNVECAYQNLTQSPSQSPSQNTSHDNEYNTNTVLVTRPNGDYETEFYPQGQETV